MNQELTISRKVHILSVLKNRTVVYTGSDDLLMAERNTHPRSYGCFVRILGPWVRENAFSPWIKLSAK